MKYWTIHNNLKTKATHNTGQYTPTFRLGEKHNIGQ